MIILLAMVLGLSVGPLAIAAAIRFLPMRRTVRLGRRTVRLGRRTAIVTFIAGLIPWIGAAAPMLTSLFPIPPCTPTLEPARSRRCCSARFQ
jgi:hypothetical protein